MNHSDFLITSEAMDKLAGQCREWIDRILLTPDESFTPTLLAQTRGLKGEPQLEIAAIVGGFNSPEEKHTALYTIGRRFYLEQRMPMAWFLLSEAWISTQALGQPRKYRLPQDDPERQEVVIFQGMSFDTTQTRHGYVPVSRDALNNLRVAGEWTFSNTAVPNLLKMVGAGWLSCRSKVKA